MYVFSSIEPLSFSNPVIILIKEVLIKDSISLIIEICWIGILR